MIDRPPPASPAGSAAAALSPALLERLPPHDLEAEIALLGSILLDSEAMGAVAALVKPEDFYRRAHQRLFEVMRVLYDRGEPLDALLVYRECERKDLLEETGGRDAIALLAGAVASPANAEHYARIVREKSIARSLIQAAAEIQQSAFAQEGRGDELLERAEQRIFELSNKRDPGHARGVADLLHEAFDEMQDKAGPPAAVQTGFFLFDDLTTGLRPGELIIVAGRPSMGKTTFALNAAMNAAVNDGKKVAIYSLEMTASNIVKNMLCASAKFPGKSLRRGGRFLSAEDHRRLADAAGPLFDAPIFVDDTPGLTPTILRSKTRRLKAKHGLDLVVIDYLQLMEAMGDVRSVESRQQEIAYISRSLKGLARELEVPVIAISQLNRDAEKREGHRPKLSDLRESGAIEQDADVICMLYRPFYYTRNETDRRSAEVIVAKQRNGPTDTVRLNFFEEFMRFDNPAPEPM
jgi:replicative DNA helicase